MNTNINLLIHKDEDLLKQKKKIRAFYFVAIVSLIVVGLISLSIFLLTQIVISTSVKKDQEDALKKISQFQDLQAKLFIVNNRVESIDEIMKTRKDLSKITSGLLAKIPSELSIEAFEVSDQTITLTGQSSSLVAIGELINNLTDMVRNKEIIKSLTLSSLTLEEVGGNYTISIKSDL